MAPPARGTVIVDGTPLLIQPSTYVISKSPLYKQARRLGEPIDLGPYSTWRQLTWRGGVGQDKWDDQEMYYSGTADTRHGYVQCCNELQRASSPVGGDNNAKRFATRPVGPNRPTYLYTIGVGEKRVYKRRSLSAGNQLAWAPALSPATGFTAIGRSYHGGQFALHIGLSDSRVFTIPSNSDAPPPLATEAILDDTRQEPVTAFGSLGHQGDIALCGRGVFKHSDGEWTHVSTVDNRLVAGVTWNQRYWFIGTDNIASSKLYTTDLITTQEIHHWANGFVALGVVVHYGTIYVFGYGHNEEFSRRIGQVWSFNGSSVRMLYEVPEEVWDQYRHFSEWRFASAVSYRRWLVFHYPQRGNSGMLYAYDPETDAIHPMSELAGVAHDNGNHATDLHSYGGRLVAAIHSEGSVHWEQPARKYNKSFLLSSEYDAGLPGVEKLWLRFRIRLKEPQPTGTRVRLYLTDEPIEADALPDQHPAWRHVGDVTATDSVFDIVRHGNFEGFTSSTIRYSLLLEPSHWSGSTINNSPKVAGVEIDFLPVEVSKKGWSFNAIGGDGLTRPDGQPYELDAAGMKAKMDELFATSGDRILSFTDEDGEDYQVRLTGITRLTTFPNPNEPDGENSLYSIQLAEI